MSSQIEKLQKNNRRSRRQQQKNPAGSASHTPSSREPELSPNSNPEKQLEQPTRILRRGEEYVAPNPLPNPNSRPPPHTPSRSSHVYEESVIKQHADNESISDILSNRKRHLKAPDRKQSGAASPKRASNSSPVSAPRHQSLTPTTMNETPVKAYAGPTFHASPAASSLPMPKFFSKSMPNIDKTSSLKSMMEQEGPQTASESEGSPFQENTQPMHDHRVREPSPLEILFRADEIAKAKARPNPESAVKPFHSQARLSASTTGVLRSNRHHSRHPTDSSTGSMFPIEMDGSAPEPAASSIPPMSGTETYPSHTRIQESSSATEIGFTEEQRRAKTAALKQLLYSTTAALPSTSSIGHRPPSSNLRQESTMPGSSGLRNPSELPATPTPSHVHKAYMSPTENHQHGYVSPYTPFTPSRNQSQGSDSTPSRNNGAKKALEDDLRRILKLEVVGGSFG